MILVAVGTFIHGFDHLVDAADRAAQALGLPGFAQIGHSRVVPRHLAWDRFLLPDELASRIALARIVVCHAGIGLVGEAMRAGKPIVLLPRRGRPTRTSPAGDQTALAWKLAGLHGLEVSEEPGELAACMARALAGPPLRTYALGSDVPTLVAGYLAGLADQSRPASSS